MVTEHVVRCVVTSSCAVTRQRSRVTMQIGDLAGEIDKGFARNHAGGGQQVFVKIRVIHHFW